MPPIRRSARLAGRSPSPETLEERNNVASPVAPVIMDVITLDAESSLPAQERPAPRIRRSIFEPYSTEQLQQMASNRQIIQIHQPRAGFEHSRLYGVLRAPNSGDFHQNGAQQNVTSPVFHAEPVLPHPVQARAALPETRLLLTPLPIDINMDRLLQRINAERYRQGYQPIGESELARVSRNLDSHYSGSIHEYPALDGLISRQFELIRIVQHPSAVPVVEARQGNNDLRNILPMEQALTRNITNCFGPDGLIEDDEQEISATEEVHFRRMLSKKMICNICCVHVKQFRCSSCAYSMCLSCSNTIGNLGMGYVSCPHCRRRQSHFLKIRMPDL